MWLLLPKQFYYQSLILKLKIEIWEIVHFVRNFFNASHNAVKYIFVYIFVILSVKTNKNIGSQAGGLGTMYMCISPISQNFAFSCQNTILKRKKRKQQNFVFYLPMTKKVGLPIIIAPTGIFFFYQMLQYH